MDKPITYSTTLSTRRTRGAEVRSEMDKELDFSEIIELKQQGLSWDEITNEINSSRPYFTTVAQNKALYHRRLRDTAIKMEADDKAQEALEDILDELDYIYRQAIKKWNDLKDVAFQDELSGVVAASDSTSNLDDFDDDELEVISAKKPKYSKKKVGLIEQHQAKYLEIARSVLDLKAKVQGVGKFKPVDTDIMQLLKGQMLDDGGVVEGLVMKSEEEVLRLFDTQTPSNFVEDLPIETYGEEE